MKSERRAVCHDPQGLEGLERERRTYLDLVFNFEQNVNISKTAIDKRKRSQRDDLCAHKEQETKRTFMSSIQNMEVEKESGLLRDLEDQRRSKTYAFPVEF